MPTYWKDTATLVAAVIAALGVVCILAHDLYDEWKGKNDDYRGADHE